MKEAWFVFLCIAAGIDLWKKNIPVCLFWMAGAAGIMGIVSEVSEAAVMGNWMGAMAVVADVAASVTIGLVLLFVSHVTAGGLGAGDAWFFLVTGLYLSWTENLSLLCYSGCFSSLYGIGVLAWGWRRRGNVRRSKIPFLPFVWMAAIVLRGVIR